MSHRLLVLLVLALCVVSTYGPTFSGSYLSDDFFLIETADSGPQPWSFLANLVTPMPEEYQPRIYREVWRASYLLDLELFGLNASVSRLFSALLHVANGFLLFLLYRKLLGNLTSAILAAALFAVFPIHLSAVAWVAARCDLMAVFFCLCALNLYASRLGERPGPGAKLAVGACVFLAIQSKETGLITVPALCALHWHFSPKVAAGASLRARWRDLWSGTWWLWAWLAINLAMRFWVLGTVLGGYNREAPMSIAGLARQLGHLGGAISFPFSPADSYAPNVPLAVLIGVGLAAAYWFTRRAPDATSRTYRFSVICFALTALPLFGLEGASSRHMYQPAAAWCPLLVVVVHGIAGLRTSGNVWIRVVVCGTLIVVSWFGARDAIRPYREGGEVGGAVFAQARSLLRDHRAPIVLYNVPDRIGPCLVGLNAFPLSCQPPFFDGSIEVFVGVTDSRTLLPLHEQRLVTIALRSDSLYFRWDPDLREFRAADPPELPGAVHGQLTVDEDGGFLLSPAGLRIEGEAVALEPLVDQHVTLEAEREGTSEPPLLRVTDAQVTPPMLRVTSGSPPTLTIAGEPGDHVFLGISSRRRFFPVGSAGTLLLDRPLPWQDIRIPASGTREVPIDIPFPEPARGVLLIQAVINRAGIWHVGDMVAVQIED